MHAAHVAGDVYGMVLPHEYAYLAGVITEVWD
jgi:hypothetical protein